MIEKWKKFKYKDKTFTVLSSDLSKGFDCLPLELIIAKLNVDGCSFKIDTQLFNESETKNKFKVCLWLLERNSPPRFHARTAFVKHFYMPSFFHV